MRVSLAERLRPHFVLALLACAHVVAGCADRPTQQAPAGLEAASARFIAPRGARLPPGTAISKSYRYLPFDRLAVSSPEGEAALLAAGAEREVAHQALGGALGSSGDLQLIGQPAVAAQGLTGAGATVVVVDGAVDVKNAAFGRCAAGELGAPDCALAAAERLAAGESADPVSAHATNVAAIALAVAPGARVAALDVMSADGKAYTGDILLAIDWAIEHQAALGVAAINLSLGAGAHDKPCAEGALATAIAWAQIAGIATAVAAGNDGNVGALDSPACAPAAVSVGATYASDLGAVDLLGCADSDARADGVACFSNAAPFLTLLAPGAIIDAGGVRMAGTSQAAPHVAGALAVLRAAFPAETAGESIARLRASAAQIADARNGLTFSRLDLVAASAAPPARLPLATVRVQNDDIFVQPTGAPLTALCVSDGPLCVQGWQPSAPQLALGARDPAALRVWVRDANGAESVMPIRAQQQ